MGNTAILVDGGYYRKRATYLWGEKTAEKRASELWSYCKEHLRREKDIQERDLYRIFYYDCTPLNMNVYHPLLKKSVHLGKTDTYLWMNSFISELKKKRKFALRLGTLSDDFIGYNLTQDATKALCRGTLRAEELEEKHFTLVTKQKGVDMKIGVDIASMAFKKQVDQMILIAGDSDFVPAAKLARREGIDFILDPMWQGVKDDLFEHIDGLQSPWKKKKDK